MIGSTRRDFLKQSASAGALALGAGLLPSGMLNAAPAAKANIRFGMVTYTWGADWDLPTLIKNLETANVLGVELRTSHAHKVEPTLSSAERAEVKKRFADSRVQLVSLGTAEEFHNPDPAKLQKAIEATKEFVKLAKDVGASGVKVRPNALPKEVPVEKTIEQIGKSLNECGKFAADYGQQIRLEIHGGCAKVPIIKQIMDIADHPSVAVCWNSNNQDLDPPGLEGNFELVKKRLGYTTHVRELDDKKYPFEQLLGLFVKAGYRGWWLLEAHSKQPDRVKSLIAQRELFEKMLAKAMG